LAKFQSLIGNLQFPIHSVILFNARMRKVQNKICLRSK